MSIIEDIIEWLEVTKNFSDESMTSEEKLAISKAIRLLEDYPKWIPCSERLPEDNEVVLCRVVSTTIASGKTYMLGSCDKGFWFFNSDDVGILHSFPLTEWKVTAWMQLPELPEEET